MRTPSAASVRTFGTTSCRRAISSSVSVARLRKGETLASQRISSTSALPMPERNFPRARAPLISPLRGRICSQDSSNDTPPQADRGLPLGAGATGPADRGAGSGPIPLCLSSRYRRSISGVPRTNNVRLVIRVLGSVYWRCPVSIRLITSTRSGSSRNSRSLPWQRIFPKKRPRISSANSSTASELTIHRVSALTRTISLPLCRRSRTP